MYLEVQNTFTFVKDGSIPIHLMNIFNFSLRQDEYAARMLPNMPIQKKSIYFPRWKAFLTGALPYLLEKYSCTLVDNRIKPEFDKSSIIIPEWLRPHQKEAFQKVINFERGIIHHTTSTGKTYFAAGIVSAIPVNHLVIVHRKEIMLQFIERFEKTLDEDFDICWGMKTQINNNRIMLAMIGSLIPRIQKGLVNLDRYESIIVDESHHIGWGSQYIDALLPANNAYFRIALTGTPKREAGDTIVHIGLIGPVIHQYTYKDALEDGLITPVNIMMIELPNNLPIRHMPVEPYHEFYKVMIVQNQSRNSIITNTAVVSIMGNRSTLVLATQIEHCEILLMMIRSSLIANGVSNEDASRWVEMVHGKDPERLQKKEDFENKNIKCLIATTLYDEGIDIHAISSIVLAAGGLSERAVLQRIGRGQRLDEGKINLIVFDFYDSFHRKTQQHSRKRLKVYKHEGYNIQAMKINRSDI